MPTACAAMPSREWSSVAIAILNPCPSVPSRLPAGMRQSWKKIAAVCEARSPSLCSEAPTLKPGASPGTTNAEMPPAPASPVRANATYQRACPALVIHAFSPSSTHSSPSRRARVRRLATSLPEPGSVRPKPPSVSPPASSRSARSRSSSLPNCRIGQQQTELVTLTVTATDGQARASSSTATT